MDLRLLEKFFDNRCSPDEVAEVLRWFASPEDQAETLSRLEDYWKEYQPDEAAPRGAAHRTLRSIRDRMAQQESARRGVPRSYVGRSDQSRLVRLPHRPFPQSLRVAAVVVLAIIGSFVLHRVLPSPSSPPIIVVKSTAPGQKHTFRLPDGTQVRLNADSELRYSAAGDDGPREILLAGEAFFKVAHDAQRPFTVTAQGVSTTALGTSFNVQAYDTAVTVALVTGKVRVVQQQQASVLAPGERVRYAPPGRFQKDRYDSLRDLAWQEGTLHFARASLSEVKQQLERWYGVTITLKGTPAQPWDYTGTFTEENLENVLTGISYTQNFAFSIQEKQAIIRFH